LNASLNPAGSTGLFPPGFNTLLPPGFNVTFPTTPIVNPFLSSPFVGITPLGLNPFILGQLTTMNSMGMTVRTPVLVSPTPGLLVSPSMLFFGSPGMNSISLVGLSSLTAGGTTTPAMFPFVVALNSDVILTPDQEKEFQRKRRLVRSQAGAASTTIWSA